MCVCGGGGGDDEVGNLYLSALRLSRATLVLIDLSLVMHGLIIYRLLLAGITSEYIFTKLLIVVLVKISINLFYVMILSIVLPDRSHPECQY